MPQFPAEAVFVVTGPDFPAEVLYLGRDAETSFADLLREYGPERITAYWQTDAGALEELNDRTVHGGRDDVAKYYSTRYTSPVTGFYIEIGWDI